MTKDEAVTAKTGKTVSLVLGSGGARGLAHIGVIHWLEEHGYVIKSISGCSMGALVGGIYAAGRLEEYEAWVREITRLDMMSFLDISWSRGGLLKGDKIINTLIELVGDRMIEDLPIDYTAVATDIKAEKEIWIQSGRLFDAIRASISLPFIFTPFKYDDLELIDGGVVNPVPIAPTFGNRNDITIAVNLGGAIEPLHRPTKMDAASTRSSSKIHQRITQFIERFQKDEQDVKVDNRGVQEVITQAFDAMQSTIARQKLAAYPPDIVISIPRNASRTLEFDRAAEMIALGYEKAEMSLKDAK